MCEITHRRVGKMLKILQYYIFIHSTQFVYCLSRSIGYTFSSYPHVYVAISGSTNCECVMQEYKSFLQYTLNDLFFILHFNNTCFWMSEIAKYHSHSGGWEHICREIPFYHVENHPQSDLVLDLVCALAPQPCNLHHCHLKNILAGHRRDSNLSFKYSYLCLRFCHQTVAIWKGTFSSIINESFLSL